MSLPKGFIEEIRARVLVSDIIGKRGVRLVRAGREFKACCPFHKENTPSFTINDQKGFYHCFGCGAHGDVIRFLTDHDNLKFMEAVEHLAGLAGMQVPQPTPQEAQRFRRQMSLYDMMELAAGYYTQQLFAPENKKILQYLTERGLSLETIKKFRIGFAPEDGAVLEKKILQSGFVRVDLIDGGMFRESQKKQGEVYPFFRNRVMFPVMDFQGRVVAFGGRVMPVAYGGPADKSAPKYINSPETEIFHKGRNLYGLSHARKAIGDAATVIVVEGYMDVIALAQAGFAAAVAPLGTALTESQIQALWKVMPADGVRAPVLCFDGDAAGQRAAARAMDRVLPILQPDHTVKFAFLPAEHDPDSLIRVEGRQAMEKIIQNASPLFDVLWAAELRGRDMNQPEEKAGYRTALLRRARDIADTTVRSFFEHEIDKKIKELYMKPETRTQGFSARERFKPRGAVPAGQEAYRPLAKKVQPLRSKKYLREQILIAAMVTCPRLYEEFSEEFGLLETDSHDYDQIRQEIIRILEHEKDLDCQAVKQHLIDSGQGRVLESVLDDSLYIHAAFAKPGQPYDVVRQGWKDTYDRGRPHRPHPV